MNTVKSAHDPITDSSKSACLNACETGVIVFYKDLCFSYPH